MSKVRRTASWTPLLAVAASVAAKRRRTPATLAVTAPSIPAFDSAIDPALHTAPRRLRTLALAVLHRALVVVSVFAWLSLVVMGIGPYSGRYRVVTVLSGSMEPNMPVGSMVIDTPIALRDVKVGDVITFQAPIADHRTVSHRVVRVVHRGNQPVVVTKGDANTATDPWEAKLTSAPAWRVRAAVPWLGYAVIALRDPTVHRVLVYVVPAVLAAIWLAAIWRDPAPDPDSE